MAQRASRLLLAGKLLQVGGAGRGRKNEKPSAPKRGRAQNLESEYSSDSLAVFYVEQVALNRHVSSTIRIAEGTGACQGPFLGTGPRSEISHETGPKRPIIKGSARSTRGTTLSRIDRLKVEIESLPGEEIAELFRWLSEKDWEKWDKEIEADSQAGKLDFLAREARDEKAKGRLKDL